MISHITKRFRKLLAALSNEIQKQAKDAYTHFKKDPYHPGLHFKRVHSTRPIYSVRISINYRAVGIQKDSEIIWFWVGIHTDYEKLLNKFSQPKMHLFLCQSFVVFQEVSVFLMSTGNHFW